MACDLKEAAAEVGMSPASSVGIVALALTVAVFSSDGRQVSPAMAEAAKASPELVGALSKEIGSSPDQAAGAAGALFGLAKSRLKPEEFSQVSAAVPGMDSLLKAAPAMTGGAGAMSSMAGSAGGLATAASAFTKLGLKPDMVGKAVPVLTSFVTKSGGAKVGSLLAGVLK
jgi:Protein of unknown function VcgC/VcgE (DUF2780)